MSSSATASKEYRLLELHTSVNGYLWNAHQPQKYQRVTTVGD